MKCLGCGDEVSKLHEDPRNPPLQEQECICKGCKVSAFDQLIEETEELLEAYREDKKELLREQV